MYIGKHLGVISLVLPGVTRRRSEEKHSIVPRPAFRHHLLEAWLPLVEDTRTLDLKVGIGQSVAENRPDLWLR